MHGRSVISSLIFPHRSLVTKRNIPSVSFAILAKDKDIICWILSVMNVFMRSFVLVRDSKTGF